LISQTKHLYKGHQERVQLSPYSDKAPESMNDEFGSNAGTGNRFSSSP